MSIILLNNYPENNLENEITNFPNLNFELIYNPGSSINILVDEYAFSMIIRNLIENTKREKAITSKGIAIFLNISNTTLNLFLRFTLILIFSLFSIELTILKTFYFPYLNYQLILNLIFLLFLLSNNLL